MGIVDGTSRNKRQLHMSASFFITIHIYSFPSQLPCILLQGITEKGASAILNALMASSSVSLLVQLLQPESQRKGSDSAAHQRDS